MLSRLALTFVVIICFWNVSQSALDAGNSSQTCTELAMWGKLNQQINIEYTAGYAYEHMAAFFGRTSVGLTGFAKFFRKAASEEFGHAREIEEYVNKRRQIVILDSIVLPAPGNAVFSSGLPKTFNKGVDAVTAALELELNVTKCLKAVHKCAGEANEPETQDFLDGFLKEQIESIEELTILQTRLNRTGSDYYVLQHLIDKELMG